MTRKQWLSYGCSREQEVAVSHAAPPIFTALLIPFQKPLGHQCLWALKFMTGTQRDPDWFWTVIGKIKLINSFTWHYLLVCYISTRWWSYDVGININNKKWWSIMFQWHINQFNFKITCQFLMKPISKGGRHSYITSVTSFMLIVRLWLQSPEEHHTLNQTWCPTVNTAKHNKQS